MWNLKFILIFIGLTMTSCSDDSGQTLDDKSIEVVLIEKDIQVDLNIENTHLPSEMIETIESLKFKEADTSNKSIGFNVSDKIKFFPIHAYVKYSDGWLIASGRGEWGGIIYWVSKKGDYRVIRDDDLSYPIDVIEDENTILITQGMLHLSLSEGHLLELNRNGGDFETRVYPVQGYPGNFKKLNGDLIVSTTIRPSGNESYYLVRELRAGKNSLYHRFDDLKEAQ